MNRDLSKIRKNFEKRSLSKADLSQHPIMHFYDWLNEAIEVNEPEPTAMTLSTVSGEGRPAGRIVLLKQVSKSDGFWFFTNYNSKKGKHLLTNNYASLSFFWPTLERQVRIEGKVHRLTDEQNNNYFSTRPINSQLSASISPQSEVIANRETVEEWYREAKSNSEIVKRPDHWGGYTLIPDQIEFWQGRSGRLHDRIYFTLSNNIWSKKRLAP